MGRTAAGLLLCAALAVAVVGCSTDRAETPPNRSSEPPFVQAGDLAEIVDKGTVRVLVPGDSDRSLPRRPSPLDDERELVRAWAEENGLDIFWIEVAERHLLIPRLLQGDGDIVAANLTVTDERQRYVAFTYPVGTVREQVIVRRGDDSIAEPADLEGRSVAVRRSSSFRRTLFELRKTYPDVDIVEVPEDLETEELIHRVAVRRLDVTVADSNLAMDVLTYRDDVRVAFDLTGDRAVAWALRPESESLRRSLNRFLAANELTQRSEEIFTGDLAQIKERRTLRLLTRNSAATYFLWRGRLMGFEYELAREFAKRHGLRLKVIVPPRDENILRWLADGRGDMVAASLTPFESRASGVAFSVPYNFVTQQVVSRVGEDVPRSIDDLADRTLYIQYSSSYWSTLSALRARGVPLILQAAPERLETEEIIDLVAEEVYDLTVADSHILDLELMFRDDVRGAFALGEEVPLSWAVRESNPDLLGAVDEFVNEEYRGLTYNVLYQKYFKDPRKARRHIEYRTSDRELSPYDEIAKRWAAEHDFDWRMIVSLIYQESQFDPRARSFAGAVGLMQVLPSTGKDLGLTDLEDPETNIRAGVKYLSWVRKRFDEDMPVRDRMWMTLASYNVGYGHVVDARRLAAQEGLNPDRWFNNVEKAILWLSRREYASRARYGYCRGSEPVRYVREIRERYHAYVDLLNPPGGGSRRNP